MTPSSMVIITCTRKRGCGRPVPTSFKITANPLVSADGKVKEVGKVIKKKEEVWAAMSIIMKGRLILCR